MDVHELGQILQAISFLPRRRIGIALGASIAWPGSPPVR